MSSFQNSSCAQRRSFYQSEPFTFIDGYSAEIVRSDVPAQKLRRGFQRLETTLEEIERRAKRKPQSWDPLVDYFAARMNFFGALLPITSSLLETLLLLYLFTTYYSFPADPETGARPPRIAELYSTFPFISCVGSKRLPVYQGLTMCVVLLNIISTSITLYRCRDLPFGWHTRRTGYLASVVGAGLSVWLVFAAANPDQHLHLFVAASKAIVIFCIKATGWFVDHLQRVKYPILRQTGVVKFLLWWKVITLTFAFRMSSLILVFDSYRTNLSSALALMTDVAIFACHGARATEIQTPGTRCYRIMAIGAPAEWLYAVTTISWTLTIAFDIYTTPIVNEVITQQDQAERRLLSPNPPSPDLITDGKEMHVDIEEEEEEAKAHENGLSWEEVGMLKRKNSGYESRGSETWDAKATGIEADLDDHNNDELGLGVAARARNAV